MSFVKSVKRGEAAENIVARYLCDYEGAISVEQAKGKFPDWDLKLLYDKDGEVNVATYEVKSDRKSEITGNFCIEYYNPKSGKPSGILSSKADNYIQFSGGKWWIAKREELLMKLIEETDMKIRVGKEKNSKVVVLPLTRITEYFEELPDLTEIPEGD